MKVILTSAVVAFVLAYAAAYVLDTRFQETTEKRFTTTGVRLGAET